MNGITNDEEGSRKSTESNNPASLSTAMAHTTWISHPLKEEPPAKTVCLIIIILTVTSIVGWSFENVGFALISLILLTASMSRYFCPTHYTLDTEIFTVSHLGMRRHHHWINFRRAIIHPDGIFISPFTSPHRLDSFRGQFLRTTNPDEIYHVVRQHIQTDAT